jgi:threonine dehydrogenase-like Zn-dependent dehydrogenase
LVRPPLIALPLHSLTLDYSGKCYFCQNGGSARCVNSQPLGSPKLDGAQAEYVRIPYADGTIIKAPDGIHDQALILMADIFPTGYFGVQSGVEMMPKLNIQDATIVVVGCGPVGLCAIVAAAALKPKHLFAVDSVQSRLDQAAKIGAEPLNFMEDREGMIERVKAVTDGRGADIVVEVVGLSPALRTAFDLVRSFGAISSIGVHNAEVSLHLLRIVIRLTLCRFLGLGPTPTSKLLVIFPIVRDSDKL